MNDTIYHNTIELRSPNASLSPLVLSNIIYTTLKIVEYCLANPEWNNLYYRWKEVAQEKNRLPNENQANLLARTIFKTKEDRIYFQMQYEKDEKFAALVKKRIVW